MGARTALPVTVLVLVLACALAAGCGSDNDNGGASAQDCRQLRDTCESCTCLACPCDAACEQGLLVFGECIDRCYSQNPEDLLACFDDCETQTTGSTRNNLTCTRAAVAGSGSCNAVCRPR